MSLLNSWLLSYSGVNTTSVYKKFWFENRNMKVLTMYLGSKPSRIINNIISLVKEVPLIQES